MQRPSNGQIYFALFLTLVSVAAVDYATGYELGFFIFYFIPVSIAAWYLSAVTTITVALLCAVCWGVLDLLSLHPYSSVFLMIWDVLIRLVAFELIGLSLNRVSRLLILERATVSQLQEALNNVKELRGLLPICASCKSIRNDSGYWQKLEGYLTQHTDAELSHGLCPECAQKLYPEYYRAEEPIHEANEVK